MIRSLSGIVIAPIAGIVLTFVMCRKLIQLIIEKNNLHDVDTWIFVKWIFKIFCAMLIVTNTWNIVMVMFQVAQNVVSQSAGDRKMLAERRNISSERIVYVTNTELGHRLLFFNNIVLPFADDFLTDTELYKLLTTKPSEV